MTTRTETTEVQTGHVGINVRDLSRSSGFYRELLGFETLPESEEEGRRFAFLGYGDQPVLTLWEQADSGFDAQRAGLHHLSFQVESIKLVQELEERARALGARFVYDGIVPHADGMQSGGVYFEDPDGVRLEIYSPTGAEGRQAPVEGGPSCGFF